MAPVQLDKIVGLQQLIVEFDERQPAFQADFVRLRRQHTVDRKMAADVAEKINVLEIQQPIGIVDDRGTVGL